MTQKRPLRVLVVEDNEDDALLVLRALTRGNFEVTHKRVDTNAAMYEALKEPWDLIISDHTMPQFSGLQALSITQAARLDIPFLMVSGTIGEDAAIEAFKAGAHDFLVKGRLARLIPAIERELREAEIRNERRRIQDALQASERRYRQIVETTREGIVMTDRHARINFVNQRMADLLGLPADALLGRTMFDFLGEDPAQPRDGRWHPSLDRAEMRMLRFDHQAFWAALSLSPIRDPQGEYAGALAMISDITEQKQLREQLMVNDRMASVGTLAAGVGHEINNPLAAALANLQLALEHMNERGETSGELSDMLNDSREALERVRVIVRDLRIFARGEENVFGAVDVRGVIESSLRMARNEIRHRAKLVKDLSAVPLVHANESRLGQVVLNLVVNAAQAIPEGHAESNEIKVRSRTDGQEHVVIEIIDTGGGIPPELMQKLFQPFYTTKPKGIGTGLGLAICHRIISDFGGKITVESAVGKGTTFRVFLKKARASTTAVSAPKLSSSAPTRRGRVLVIDDEPMVGAVVKRTLSPEHEVVVESRADEGLRRMMGDAPYDVVLCDLMMPQMTGMDLHREVAKLAPSYLDRFVFLTGGAFTPQTGEFLDTLTSPHLEKPFEPENLRALVNAHIR